MNHKDRIHNMEQHLEEHPKDYQTVIALLKAKSDYYDHSMKRIKDERVKKVAEMRRRLHEESEQ